MRVIGGKFKGKKLLSPSGREVRPTTDRIKETVFNILYSKGYPVANCGVLDLFAGGGALGIEALSRGAGLAVFVDKNPASIALIKSNLANIGTTAEIYTADYAKALEKLRGRSFEMIFLDPPYGDGLIGKALDYIIKYDILALDGIIIAETSSQKGLPEVPNGFIIDERRFGNTSVSFLQKENANDR